MTNVMNVEEPKFFRGMKFAILVSIPVWIVIGLIAYWIWG